jgi:hypothetical protein
MLNKIELNIIMLIIIIIFITTTNMSEKKTFASHSRAKYWSAKNAGLPADYSLNSHKKCWFDCDCGHVFEMILRNINSRNSWCPYCVNPNKKLCENLECEQCFENHSLPMKKQSIGQMKMY